MRIRSRRCSRCPDTRAQRSVLKGNAGDGARQELDSVARGRFPVDSGLPGLELFDRARPVILEEPRERAIREHAPTGLAARAVVGLILGIADTLHGRAADRAGLAEAAVNGHLRAKRSDFLRELITRLRPQSCCPFDQYLPCGF